MSQLVKLAKEVIANTNIMVLATVDNDGFPWLSPVFFNHDKHYNLYWTSYSSTHHSDFLRKRPQVMIVIIGLAESRAGDHGIYITAKAHELNDEREIDEALPIMRQRPQEKKYLIETASDVTGDSPWRIYKAVPKEFSHSRDTTIDGYAGTLRESIDSSEMCNNRQ